MNEIFIKYHDETLGKIKQAHEGEWFDLRAAEDCIIREGEFKMISLGVSMQLPEGYEAIVAPRSSTFKNWGIIQTNGIGIIDNAYCGDNDIWRFPMFCLQGKEHVPGGKPYSIIKKGDRICQFRIQKSQGSVNVKEVSRLGNVDRKGIGSTGVN